MTINASDCTAISMMLDAFHDGELSPRERANVEEHLSSCDSCRQTLEQIKVVADSLKSLPQPVLKRDFAADIDKLLAAPKPKVVPFKKAAIFGAAGIAAAIAALVLAINAHSPLATHELASQPGTVPAKVANAGQTAATSPVQSQATSPAQSQVISPAQTQSMSPAQSQARRGGKTVPHANLTKLALATAPAQSQTLSKIVPETPGQKVQGSAAHRAAEAQVNTPSTKTPELVAAYDPEQTNSITEELGITTDEDGLYAIKL